MDEICKQAAKRTRPLMNTTTLCRACSGIDLVMIFEGKVKESRIPPRSVRAASESNCALCQLVYRSFAKANADYTTDQLLELNLTYTFYPERLGDEDLPRRTEVADYWRVRISTNTFSQRVPRPLDLIGDAFNDHRNPRRLLMKRKLMRKTFDITDLRTWLATCDQDHKQKPQSSAYDSKAALSQLISSNRFRLIDVRDKKIVVVSEECRFFALSYVWGDTVFYSERYCPYDAMTPSKTVSARKKDVWPIDWSRVSRSIRDAAALVEALNERYIWVDALCINQYDKEDKELLVALMDTIYENAYLTIVAASGNNADAGLARFSPVRTREAEYADGMTATCQTSRGEITLVPSMPGMVNMLRQSKWGSRGWTYQEFQLSKRAVCFTENEVFFTCEEEILREAYELVQDDTKPPSSQILPIADKGLSVHEVLMGGLQIIFRTYCQAVGEFTRRELSYVRDRLIAFAGILHRMEALESKQYLYTFNGLPSQWFYHALAWESARNGATLISNEVDGSDTCNLPSWSWAGWTGEAWYQHNREAYNPLRVKALDQYNIVGSPVKEDFWWKHWPVVPALSTGSTQSRTILHLFAPILRLTIGKESFSGKRDVFAGDIVSDTDTTRIGYTRSWNGEKRSSDLETADVIALPQHCDPMAQSVEVFGIIFERHSVYARRVESLNIKWEFKGSLTDLEHYVSREYVQLC